jgi:hypothetical protein
MFEEKGDFGSNALISDEAVANLRASSRTLIRLIILAELLGLAGRDSS